MTTLVELQERVAKGMQWLADHDPDGSFHFWFESGITPLSPLPAQDAARQAEWRAYYPQRQLFERLWSEMDRREKSGESNGQEEGAAVAGAATG